MFKTHHGYTIRYDEYAPKGQRWVVILRDAKPVTCPTLKAAQEAIDNYIRKAIYG